MHSYIFLCSDATQQECLDRGLLGGNKMYKNLVEEIEKGDELYLYNYETFLADFGTQIVPLAEAFDPKDYLN